MNTNILFEDWLEEKMQVPGFRDAMEELELGFQVARLRIKRGLTQKELAQLVGTRQSSISRLETGKSQPSVSFLRRIAEALQAKLVFEFALEESSVQRVNQPVIVSSGQSDGYYVRNWPTAERYRCPSGWSDRAVAAS